MFFNKFILSFVFCFSLRIYILPWPSSFSWLIKNCATKYDLSQFVTKYGNLIPFNPKDGDYNPVSHRWGLTQADCIYIHQLLSIAQKTFPLIGILKFPRFFSIVERDPIKCNIMESTSSVGKMEFQGNW